MKVGSFTAANGSTEHKFDVPQDFGRLVLRRRGAQSLGLGFFAAIPERVSNSTTDVRGNERIYARNGSLAHIVALSQHAGAYVYERIIGGVPTVNLPVRVVRNSASGLLGDADAPYQVHVSGAVVGATYDLFALPCFVTGTDYFEYVTVRTLSGQDKRGFDVAHAAALLLPADATKITRVNVTASEAAGGETRYYTLEEIRMENMISNPIESFISIAGDEDVIRLNGPMTSDFVILDLANVDKVEIETDMSIIECTLMVARDFTEFHQG
jgi:hypothetical protein